jgi:hypothetical protein
VLGGVRRRELTCHESNSDVENDMKRMELTWLRNYGIGAEFGGVVARYGCQAHEHRVGCHGRAERREMRR